MLKPKTKLLTALAGAGLVLAASQSHAALVTSNLETFSGGGGGSANTSIYTLDSTTFSSFTLENSVTDGSFLDGADDGYANILRTDTVARTNIVKGAYGTITAGDIGKVVSIDAAFRHEQGVDVRWSIQLDGTDIGSEGDQDYFRARSFSAGDLANDANHQLSNIAAGADNIGRTTGPLTYTIQAGDVGKALGLELRFYDSSNLGFQGTREVYIDSISYAVPEPGSLALLAAGGLLMIKRRRRNSN